MQRCCVANSSDVTVLAAGPVVAIVKITSAHMLFPFVVVLACGALDIMRCGGVGLRGFGYNETNTPARPRRHRPA
jgi:hypothetical protein